MSRCVPTISQQWVCERATLYKLQLLQKANTLATQSDDDVLIELEAKYKGNILYDYETRARQKLFRVVAVQYVKSKFEAVSQLLGSYLRASYSAFRWIFPCPNCSLSSGTYRCFESTC